MDRERLASRPEEFHPRPLTERCGSLSAHTAPTKQPMASLPPRSPPVASWTLKTTAWPNPFAPAALPAFIARTGWSVPVLRIGTLASWWSPLGLLPWHRSDRFPQFHMRARIRLAPPIRRSPSAPYPGGRRTLTPMLTTDGSLPQQLGVVWSRLLEADSEGPSFISHAACAQSVSSSRTFLSCACGALSIAQCWRMARPRTIGSSRQLDRK